MQGHEKYQNLHTIVMLGDLVRKWWRMELSFADAEGRVLGRKEGELTPPPNDFCRLSLFSREGYRRCNQGVKVLHEKFRAGRKTRSCLAHDCHLGFGILGAPIYVQGEYEGLVFVEGFARQKPDATESEALKRRILELNPASTELDRAVGRIPVLSHQEIERLQDLLEFAVSEIANFDVEQSRREEFVGAVEPVREGFDAIVGKAPAMQALFQVLERVAASESTVLIHGESGTGKELVARALHFHGPRRERPFVVQNCSAFNDNLLESALFGHVKGAFTGALRDKKGLFEVADTGTFFLDEVGDMSPALQVKLLRVLQEGTFTPVGGTAPKEVDVRVIAASHKDLAQLVEKGQFREDLFYRLHVIKVSVPPLRERREDLPLLIEAFLRKHSRADAPPPRLADETVALLHRHGWPGNVRELQNEIERLVVLGQPGKPIGTEALSPRIREAAARPVTQPAQVAVSPAMSVPLHQAVEGLERRLIAEGLSRTRGNKSQLARDLGVSRSNLILKIEKYGLERPGSETEENEP